MYENLIMSEVGHDSVMTLGKQFHTVTHRQDFYIGFGSEMVIERKC
jgi:hypothetical protein